MKHACVLLMFLSLIGCATDANFQKYANYTVGKNISTAMDLWGYPVSEIQAPNGNKVYVFSKSRYSTGYQMPSHTTVNMMGNMAYATTQPGAVIGRGTVDCTAWVEVDKNNTILKWTWEGNGCKLDQGWVKKPNNPDHVDLNYYDKVQLWK